MEASSPPQPGPRLLLLMATQTYRAGAFLDAASRLRIPVAVASEETHALAHLHPAGHLTVDFNDLEGATDRIVEFAADRPLEAVIAAEDDGVLLAAMACDALRLTHSPLVAVRTARDKYQTRQALAAAGMRTPPIRLFSIDDPPAQAARRVGYPCVVKPLALSASRGVMRADGPGEFVAAFQRLSGILRSLPASDGDQAPAARRHILAESFIPGFEVAVEGLLDDRRLTVLALFDKPDPLDGPFFEESIYVTPSRHPAALQDEILRTTRQAVAALDLTQGPIHAELRVNAEGAWVLEVAPRSIGGYCSRALRFGTDTTLEELILQQALGLPLSSTRPAAPASGVMMIPIPQAGVLCEVRGLQSARQIAGISEVLITIPPGGAVVPPPEGSRYLGFIFAQGETAEAVEAALRQAHAQLRFTIEPAAGSPPDRPERAGG